jgi:hypothetical protein
MNKGYVYCFSNPSMPGILKIGMTERTPLDRLCEANSSDTWRPPTPYKIEFAKLVSDSCEKEKTLHILLEQYTERINPKREFFRVSKEEVLKFFELMDGEMWKDTFDDKKEKEFLSESGDEEISCSVRGCRDMSKCFINNQRIRHTIGINKIWIGVYNSLLNSIVYNDKVLSLNKFVCLHYETERPDRTPRANAWRECECEIDGKWISTYNLPEI